MSQLMSLAAEAEQRQVAIEVSSQRTVEWMIRAENLAPQHDRAPLNLALVIDRSGSMHGEKLHYAQQAACYVLDQLTPRDRAAVVSYDDTVQTVAPSTLIEGGARERLKAAVNALRPGGSTNLSGGWLEGCRLIAEQISGTTVSRALLLTDGLANHGIVDVEELSTHARELRRRGVATSTFGVGLDFNEQLLELIAEHGGGQFSYIERPDQIPAFFRRELGDLLAVVGREAVLVLHVPKGVAIEVLGDLPNERTDDTIRVFLGDLVAGEQRAMYTRVLTPPDAPGTSIRLRATLGFADLDAQARSVDAEIVFSYVREAEVRLLPVARDILERAGEIELAAAAQKALRLERAGQRQQAQALLRAQLIAAPAAAPAMAAYNDLADQIGNGLSEAERKQAHFESYQARQARKK